MVGGSSSWLDLNKDGKRMESLLKEMRTKSKIALAEDNYDMYFAYIDRFLKAQTTKTHLAEIVLNVKGFLALAQKQYGKLPTGGVLTAD